MKKLMHILFLSCLKASELIEKKLFVNLTTLEKVQLKAHKMMCKACALYEKQSSFLDKGIKASQKNNNLEFDLNQFIKLIKDKLAKSSH